LNTPGDDSTRRFGEPRTSVRGGRTFWLILALERKLPVAAAGAALGRLKSAGRWRAGSGPAQRRIVTYLAESFPWHGSAGAGKTLAGRFVSGGGSFRLADSGNRHRFAAGAETPPASLLGSKSPCLAVRKHHAHVAACPARRGYGAWCSTSARRSICSRVRFSVTATRKQSSSSGNQRPSGTPAAMPCCQA